MMGKMGGSDKKFVAPDAVSNQPLSSTHEKVSGGRRDLPWRL